MYRGAQTLVTGASGFVGSAVARTLTGAGFRVRALVRPGSPRFHLDGLDLEFSEGDLRDPASIRRAMAGVRYVFHVAADYRLWARDKREIYGANVGGTRNLMQEALRAGVERVVHTSSVATLGLKNTPADETSPLSEEQGIGAYKRSKIAAERLVEAMIARDKLPAVIVNPSTPIGPRDVKPTPTGRIIVEAALGRIPAFVDTGLNLVHVDDIADGHIAALKQGVIGERYILGGTNVLFADMLADIARLVGRRPPTAADSPQRRHAGRVCGGGDGLGHRTRAVRHRGRHPHGQAPHVLHRRQGGARTWLSPAAVFAGPRRCDPLVSPGRISGGQA